MPDNDYEKAIEDLAKLVGLSPEAVYIAEGWMLLDERAQRHFKLLIDDHVANQIPMLKPYYDAASLPDQIRFNRIVERYQGDIRGVPPEDA